ncbi:hypothetical protein [Nocardia ignorata]|uniref:Uncharacterized protein n=1 Tax=Nocardia ignorata TaxID=145285 RepID=A0A4R6P2F7_NOCIG|nr:hypothetical protein [Nocardia ignorata]TDP31914.1 hypothetical protein DFR75_107139 [Nocardia ignorata]
MNETVDTAMHGFPSRGGMPPTEFDATGVDGIEAERERLADYGVRLIHRSVRDVASAGDRR